MSDHSVRLGDQFINEVGKFKYFVSIILENGRIVEDVDSSIRCG